MLKVGFLGAGRVIQSRVAEVFEKEITGATVTLVCDKNYDRAKVVADQLDATIVTDDQQLYQSDVDVIFIGTESGYHDRDVNATLDAGKHVIVEKPPSFFSHEILSCEHKAISKKLMYAPIFQNRLNPAMRALKQAFDQGRFGKLVLGTVRLRWCRYQEYYEDGWHGTWALDGGVINQQAIHHLDALQWICGDIDAVSAMQTNALNQLEAEDTTVATVRFKNGALGAIEATTATRPEDVEASISIIGEKGFVIIGGIALNRIEKWQFIEEYDDDQRIPEIYSQEVPTGYGLSHGPLIQETIDRIIAGRTDPVISPKSTIPTINLVHALYRSAELHQEVSVGEQTQSEKLGRAT